MRSPRCVPGTELLRGRMMRALPQASAQGRGRHWSARMSSVQTDAKRRLRARLCQRCTPRARQSTRPRAKQGGAGAHVLRGQADDATGGGVPAVDVAIRVAHHHQAAPCGDRRRHALRARAHRAPRRPHRLCVRHLRARPATHSPLRPIAASKRTCAAARGASRQRALPRQALLTHSDTHEHPGLKRRRLELVLGEQHRKTAWPRRAPCGRARPARPRACR
jgi:hypothetical protein